MIQKHKSSAILLSFFMMCMLILVSLGVSYLVIQDLRTVRTVVAGAQASYAAEGMIELGLHMVKDNLPGYENIIEESEDYFDLSASSLELVARGNTIPCEGQGEEDWYKLSKNESVQIPLFVQEDDDGNVTTKVTDFSVFFYLGDEDGNAINVEKYDILRWKIIGFTELSQKTEAMSNFVPLHPDYDSSAESPTEIGPNADYAGYSVGKYTSAGGFTGDKFIHDFIDTHSYNYFILTNIYGYSQAYIYYRFETGAEMACPYVEVNGLASNEFGEARQSLKTFMREGENLPAYDFVLYNTDYDENEISTSEATSSFSLEEFSFPYPFPSF